MGIRLIALVTQFTYGIYTDTCRIRIDTFKGQSKKLTSGCRSPSSDRQKDSCHRRMPTAWQSHECSGCHDSDGSWPNPIRSGADASARDRDQCRLAGDQRPMCSLDHLCRWDWCRRERNTKREPSVASKPDRSLLHKCVWHFSRQIYRESNRCFLCTTHDPTIPVLGTGSKQGSHADWIVSPGEDCTDKGAANCSSDCPSALTPNQSSITAPSSIRAPAPR